MVTVGGKGERRAGRPPAHWEPSQDLASVWQVIIPFCTFPVVMRVHPNRVVQRLLEIIRFGNTPIGRLSQRPLEVVVESPVRYSGRTAVPVQNPGANSDDCARATEATVNQLGAG
jgi:hypothetical protein